MKKKYILIAGVNGAGKSTLYETIAELKVMDRINVDELVREIGSWRNSIDVFKAGKIAVKRLEDYFTAGRSFNQETTLCGKSIIRNIEKAKQIGYLVEMHYVGVDNVDIAKQRIAYRVANGGHGIPDEDVERRYAESFKQLKQVMEMIDLLIFYDNTEQFRRFAFYKKGKPIKLSKNIPQWFQKNTPFSEKCSHCYYQRI